MDIPIIAMIRRDAKKDLENLGMAIDQLLADNESLRTRVQEFNKDDEIQSKDAELRSVWDRALCVMSEKEVEARCEFMERHWKSCNNPNNFIYDLTGTGVGTVTKIKCPKCGEEKDITDYDCW